MIWEYAFDKLYHKRKTGHGSVRVYKKAASKTPPVATGNFKSVSHDDIIYRDIKSRLTGTKKRNDDENQYTRP
jgi:hypothetical protein